jgi:hypothetical protein
MRDWLRRWLGVERRRGTLTLRNNGSIIGLPEGTTQEEAADVVRQLAEWRGSEERKALVFPWPVDVTDLRSYKP